MAPVSKKLDFSTRLKTFSTLKIKDELIKESKSIVKTKDLCEKYEVNKSTVYRIFTSNLIGNFE